MRIKGPAGGAPPVAEVDEAAAPGPAAPAAVPSSRPVGEVAPAAEASRTDRVADIARRLRAGELSPREALEHIIDDVVDRQTGGVLADRRVLAAELKELLRKQTESDPYLASKVRRLGNRS